MTLKKIKEMSDIIKIKTVLRTMSEMARRASRATDFRNVDKEKRIKSHISATNTNTINLCVFF